MSDKVIHIKAEYQSLYNVLLSALSQAQDGKGKERHQLHSAEYFEKQKICEIGMRVGLGYNLGQAIKKAEEAQGLGIDRGIQEILGAINYLASAVIVWQQQEDHKAKPDSIKPLSSYHHTLQPEEIEALLYNGIELSDKPIPVPKDKPKSICENCDEQPTCIKKGLAGCTY